LTEKKWLEGSGDRTIEQLIDLEHEYRIDSVVVAIEDTLMDKPSLTATEHIVLAGEAMEREVNSGGFKQFFSYTNEYAPILVAALRKIGVPKAAVIAEKAMRALGAEPDWSSEEYEEAASYENESVIAALNECDDAYYANDEAIADRLFEFIKTNRSDINLGADST